MRAHELLVNRARELASTPAWTPELERQLASWRAAGDQLAALGRANGVVQMAIAEGELLRRAGRLDEACARLEDVLESQPRATLALPYLLLRLAEWERERNAPSRALAWLERFEGLALSERARADLESHALLVRAQTCLDLGLPDRAGPDAREALRRAEERPRTSAADELFLLQARNVAVALTKASGDHAGAIEASEGWLAQTELYATHPAERAILTGMLGTSLVATGCAESQQRGAALLREALCTPLPAAVAAHARCALARLALAAEAWDEARAELAAARAALGAGTPEREGAAPEAEASVVAFEARLARLEGAAPDVLRARRADLARALDARVEAWSRVPARAGGTAFLLYGQRRQLAGELVELDLALDGAAAALARVEGFRARLAPERVRAHTAGAPLPPRGRGVLVVFPAADGSHAFAVDADGVRHVALADEVTLEEARRAYESLLLGGLPEDEELAALAVREERRLAACLAEVLLPGELGARIASWKELVVVGTDLLGPVPLAWLPAGEHAYLGAHVALCEAASLAEAVAPAREDAARYANDVVLVAGVTPAASVQAAWPGVGPLPRPDALVRTLDGLWAPERTRVLCGPDATLDALAAAGSVRVLQLLVHAVQEPERERPAALVLGPAPGTDGLVRYETVQEALPAAGLVILTACRSGQGTLRKGDPGATDLGGAWLAHGAHAVLQTRADLRVQRAEELSRTLHENLARGRSPAEALRRARAALVAQAGERAPFDDGLLELVGRGHDPVLQARGARAIGPLAPLCGAFVLGALVALAAARRRAG